MLRAAIVVTAALAVAGCVSVPTAAPELQAAAVTFKPAPGMARIYVLMVELAPGPHRVSSPTGENESAVSIDAVADSIYFVKLWPKMGFFSAHSGMERMDPAEARNGIATARMVASTWPGTPTREQQ